MLMRTLGPVLSYAAICLTGIPSAAVAAQRGDDAARYPARPIRVVVPFTPGGQPDIFARIIGQKAADALGQQIVVDNRAGAGGMIGSQIVAEATPDGYTLLSISAAHSILPFVRKLPFDTQRAFAGVTMAYSTAYVLVVPPALSVKTVQDLIALAKAKPRQLNMASAGSGSGTHFAGEMFKYAAGVELTHVPYKGIPEATTDIIANRTQLFMAPLAPSVPLVKDGKLRALGVSTTKRADVLPDVPTLAESGLPGFRWDSWGAIFAPAKTPRVIIEKLNREMTRALGHPDVQKQMRALGAEPAPTTPAELDKFVADELVVVAKLAKAAGITPQ